VLSLPSVQSQIKSGMLRAIGTASTQRLAAAPEIPTFAEQGLPNYVGEGWFAVVGPKNLPPADVRRTHDAFTTAFNTPEVKEAMGKQGNTIAMSTPEAANTFFRSELAKYAALVKKAGLEPQ
jgi:tripartite-type tricarboxylate transporter receptor subunit TctC